MEIIQFIDTAYYIACSLIVAGLIVVDLRRATWRERWRGLVWIIAAVVILAAPGYVLGTAARNRSRTQPPPASQQP